MCDGGGLAVRISSLGASRGRSWFGTSPSTLMQGLPLSEQQPVLWVGATNSCSEDLPPWENLPA